MHPKDITRLQIKVSGIVQGVGFRPFVSKLANEFGLTGFVRNSQTGVDIEVEGANYNLENFTQELQKKAPPLSEIIQLDAHTIPIKNSIKFEIVSSSNETGNQTLISPDVCICDECIHELFDHENRRYLYPFINCTNCGPRLTIIENIPYDRKYTTMKNFKMCDDCESEYRNPENRRFHAQPNACPKCGPKVWYLQNDPASIIESNDAIKQAAKDLAYGKIVAIKGLGGFHLAADAYNDQTVKLLRKRKHREEKPLAVMVQNIESLKKLVLLNKEEKILLTSFVRPILLLKKKNCTISGLVAPNNNRLGVMIAYTPLHHILFHEFKKYSKNKPPVIVMTSANFTEEPIETTNEGALENLSGIADSFLFHNRDILIRADDSVAICLNNKPRIIRRSRGYVPRPFFIKKKGFAILGVGAELKNTISLLKEDKIFTSQHIGDLTNYSAHKFFKETIDYLQKIINCKAEYAAYDLHPDYLSTRWIKEENSLPSFGIQHHHAHMAACMGENNLNDDVIGIILDGTGYGLDKTIWGGEILVGNYTNVKRYSYLEQFPIPGGDSAIREPWRTGLSYIYNVFDGKLPHLDFINGLSYEIVLQMLEKKINSPLTSSAGRLFDAVSVICGGPKIIRYEAQAAIEFMHKIETMEVEPYELDEKILGPKFIPLKKLIRNIYDDSINKIPVSIISARFHKTIAMMLVRKAEHIRKELNINNVVLSGGVFQNEFLFLQLENELLKLGFNVFSHSKIPTNDGGISFGQVMIANELFTKGMNQVKFLV